jgi:hypothetical protein
MSLKDWYSNRKAKAAQAEENFNKLLMDGISGATAKGETGDILEKIIDEPSKPAPHVLDGISAKGETGDIIELIT